MDEILQYMALSMHVRALLCIKTGIQQSVQRWRSAVGCTEIPWPPLSIEGRPCQTHGTAWRWQSSVVPFAYAAAAFEHRPSAQGSKTLGPIAQHIMLFLP